MAKQIGDIRITGTVAGVTFYKMDGEYYARRKSSLSGKRVKRDPKFRRTMQSAGRLARGSQLASRVYRSLPREERVYAWFVELKSAAIRGLKEGLDEAEVLENLRRRLAAERRSNSAVHLKFRYTGEDASMGAPAAQPKGAGKQKAAVGRKGLRPRAGRALQLVVGADGGLRGRWGEEKKRAMVRVVPMMIATGTEIRNGAVGLSTTKRSSDRCRGMFYYQPASLPVHLQGLPLTN